MPFPVSTLLIFIFIIWLQYEIRKSSRKSKLDSDAFWDKETKANTTRRKGIDNLEYLKLQLELLPMSDKEDQTLNSYRDTIRNLSDQRIINLTGVSNTDLKNKYGIANLNRLTEYDNNYAILVSMLQKWAERLYLKGFEEDALSVLEFAVSCNSDVNKTYLLLADLYKKRDSSEKINDLIQIVNSISIHDKDKLIQELNLTLRS